MADFNMMQALDSTTSVHGSPGLFYPADKAKLERLWHKLIDIAEMATGLAEALSRIELLEEATGDLTDIRANIEGLQIAATSLRSDLEESNAQFEAFSSDTNVRFTAVELNLDTVEESLGTMADEQLDYVRDISYATDTGVLHFFNGYNADIFTIGGATYETIAEGDADSDSDSDSDGGSEG